MCRPQTDMMASLLDNMIWNALEASILALAVGFVIRIHKLSAPLRHVLWLMVVVKLLLPPVVAHSFGLSRGCAGAARSLEAYLAERVLTQILGALPLPGCIVASNGCCSWRSSRFRAR